MRLRISYTVPEFIRISIPNRRWNGGGGGTGHRALECKNLASTLWALHGKNDAKSRHPLDRTVPPLVSRTRSNSVFADTGFVCDIP